MSAILLWALLLVSAGCGVQPSSVLDGGRAPTGIASGTPVYYVDDVGNLVVDRAGESLDTVGQALKLLLSRRPPEGLHTYASHSGVTLQFPITRDRGVITVMLPIERDDVLNDAGIDQLVCTVLAVHQQSGGQASTRVRLSFVQGFETGPRACPVLPKH